MTCYRNSWAGQLNRLMKQCMFLLEFLDVAWQLQHCHKGQNIRKKISMFPIPVNEELVTELPLQE